MTPESDILTRECRVFTRYLSRRDATEYVVTKYLDAHRLLATLTPADRFEGVLVSWASATPTMARLADAYVRRCHPRGVLRKKLVLLLAVLETTPPFCDDIDVAPDRSSAAAVMSLAIAGVVGLGVTVVGVTLFGIARVLLGPERRVR